MEVTDPQNYLSIGDEETIDDTEFLDRLKEIFNPYDGSICPKKHKKWQWSELKSSFLTQFIISDNVIENELLEFVRNIITTIYNSKGTPQQFVGDFNQFVSNLGTAPQYSIFDSYPTAQSPAFANKPAEAWNDVLIIYNFIKFIMWGPEPTRDNPNPRPAISNCGLWDPQICNSGALEQCLTIKLVMQPIFNFFGMVRGDRKDNKFADLFKWDQIGITYITHPALKRVLKQFPTYQTKPWMHAGNALCKMPYWGKWGQKIREARQNNEVWGSLMCGISGSTQFVYFAFLIAIGFKKSVQPSKDIKNLISLAAAILNGGHNIREVIYGITLTTIMLHMLIQEFELELQTLFSNTDDLKDNVDRIQYTQSNMFVSQIVPILGALLNKINNQVQILDCQIEPNINNDIPQRNMYIFKNFLQMCVNWKEVVWSAYDFTKNLNITGVNADDLNSYDSKILQNPQQTYLIYKQAALNYLMGVQNPIFAVGGNNLLKSFNNNVQILLALENDRYTKNNWDNGANYKMEKIIRGYPSGDAVLAEINDLMNDRLKTCKEPEVSNTIPFA